MCASDRRLDAATALAMAGHDHRPDAEQRDGEADTARLRGRDDVQ
jgi:hypothetical protein